MNGVLFIKACLLSCCLLCASLASAQVAESPPSPEVETVNINQADAPTLARILNGVGMSRAEAIIHWREENGPFQAVEDLMKVSGIGEATVQRNLERIRLD